MPFCISAHAATSAAPTRPAITAALMSFGRARAAMFLLASSRTMFAGRLASSPPPPPPPPPPPVCMRASQNLNSVANQTPAALATSHPQFEMIPNVDSIGYSHVASCWHNREKIVARCRLSGSGAVPVHRWDSYQIVCRRHRCRLY